MTRQQFYNESEDIKWILETHLKNAAEFHRKNLKSFVLEGNEDCPQRIICYAVSDPECATHPFVTYILNSEMNYQKEVQS